MSDGPSREEAARLLRQRLEMGGDELFLDDLSRDEALRLTRAAAARPAVLRTMKETTDPFGAQFALAALAPVGVDWEDAWPLIEDHLSHPQGMVRMAAVRAVKGALSGRRISTPAASTARRAASLARFQSARWCGTDASAASSSQVRSSGERRSQTAVLTSSTSGTPVCSSRL